MLSKSPVHRSKLKNQLEFSDVLSNIKRRDDVQNNIRSISIKINRNKLPSDFFPRTESVRKNKGGSVDRKGHGDFMRKAESERDHYSPQKTSFFGFFQEKPLKKTIAQLNNLKRKFQSREEPKRDRIVPQYRHYTPMNGIQRSDILYLYPDRPDIELGEALKSSSKNKGLQLSARKEHLSKYRQMQQQMGSIDPQKQFAYKDIIANSEEFLMKGEQESPQNITFFNARSTSFPPINKNKN